ncbi:DNA polymerase III subunit delta' [Aliiglaciecola litoralis]|uniref:DNA-directed DNA polymerase n=1 Tax=Aliiglaciecola litoralis TaxID=582857 RepID=A0ABN1LBQ5_9ALTE
MLPWLETVYQKLLKRAEKSTLHHGLLIVGPQGIGKTHFCNALAKPLLCKPKSAHTQQKPCGECQSCHLFEAHSHPDMHRIHSEKQVGVDLVRNAIEKLLGKAQLSGNKVLIIERADTMTESAANALLKTLEEPTDNTYLMLVSSKPERLLPTILSRCEKVVLTAPELSVCMAWLKQQGHEQVDESLVQVYNQRPFRIIEELTKESGLTHPQFVAGIAALQSDADQAVKLAEKWQSDADQVVLWLQHLLRNNALEQHHSESFWQCNQNLSAAVKALQNPGINRILVLTGLLQSYRQLNQS